MDTRKATGRAALVVGGCLVALIPIVTTLWPMAGADAADFTRAERFLPFVRDHRLLFAAPYAIGLAMHLAGIALVVGVYRLMRERSEWIGVAAVAGLFWMAFDVAFNGIVLHVAPELATPQRGPDALIQFEVVSRTLSALQLTGHVGGGLWILGTSLVALRRGGLPRGVSRFGVLAGSVFAMSFAGPRALYPSFLLIPAWFLWLGGALMRLQSAPRAAIRAETA